MAETNTINKITIGANSRYIEDEYLSKALRHILGYSEDTEFIRGNTEIGSNWNTLRKISDFIDEHNETRIEPEKSGSPFIHLRLADEEGNRPIKYLNGNAEYISGFNHNSELSAITDKDNSPVLVSGLRKVLDYIYERLGKEAGSSGDPITFKIVSSSELEDNTNSSEESE